MDPVGAVGVSPIFIYVAAAGLVVVVLIIITLMKKPHVNAQNEDEIQGPPRQLQRNVGNVPPRARRRRMDRRAAQDESDEDPLDGDDILDSAPVDERWGAKKQKKMQEKEERRAMRLQEEQERKDKKRRDADMELIRKKDDAKEKAEEAIREEEERLRKEVDERREHEEYLKLKEAFSVEEEGEDEAEADLTTVYGYSYMIGHTYRRVDKRVDPNSLVKSQTLLHQFITYIKDMKVVMLEDLAAHFKIKTQDAINRIQDLQAEGRLTGVIDDRGKFIYITIEELEAVAKFIKQHGRVSISELAESSNRLINLTPDNADVHKKLLTDVAV